MERKLVVKCDVYSRVVGYYSPTSQWNIGKKQEFKERVKYDRAFDYVSNCSCGNDFIEEKVG